jgi:hypothetical protein
MLAAWRARLAASGICVALVCGCRGGKGSGLDAGWVGTPWTGALRAAPARTDSALARADAGGGNGVSPVEASTERLAARTRVGPETHSREKAKRPLHAAHMREGEVRQALERFKYAQARMFRLKRTYSGEPGAIDYHRPAGTTVRVVWANKWGWAALAADSLAPDEYCAVYVGSVPDAITPTAHHWGKPGTVYCDGQTDGEALGRSVLYGSETPEQTLARFAMTMMPTNLMQLAISQDAYRKVQYTYARRIEPMALQYGWQPGVRVRMLFASSEGWAAEASYDLLPGRSCVIWGGTVPQRPATRGQHRIAGQEGVPVCDE